MGFYLFFGHVDHFIEMVMADDPTDVTWDHAANFLWQVIALGLP